jgi:hypothetical protein
VGITRNLLMRMFGHPQGALGRLGGIIMARANYDCGAWIIELLEVRPNDRVLEVGFSSPNGSPRSKATTTVPPRIGRRTRYGTPPERWYVAKRPQHRIGPA